MNINRSNPSQFELFPDASQSKTNYTEKVSYQLKNITLTPENLITGTIVAIMTFVFFFAVGVERGKNVIVLNDGAGKINTVQIEKSDIMSQSQTGIKEVVKTIPVALESPKPALEGKQEVINIEALKKKYESLDDVFTIQVASFKLQKNAQKEADLLKKKGYDQAFVLPKGKHSIVCIGRFPEQAEAKLYSKKLKVKYGDSLIRRL